MRFLFIFSVFLVVNACQTSKKSLNADSSPEASIIISMKKTACYGTCPVYTIQIYSDLRVRLKGEQYIDHIGDFNSVIEKGRFESLIRQFKDSDFFSFEEKYWEAYSDLPTTYVYFSDGGHEKEVMDYYGAPQSLRDLEAEIARLLEELEWRKNVE